MSGFGTMRYWIDDIGRLWHGPTAPAENLHYATFEGYTITTEQHEPIWVLRRSDPPTRCDEISSERANRIMERYRQEAVAERKRRAS